jgi:tricorn protease-like protein
MNCHTFNRNNPNEWLFHVRGSNGGTVIYKDGLIRKMEFPVPEIISAGAYCNWHPDGRKIAFAVNKIKQNYYLSGYSDKMKEVFDLESDIVLYDTETNIVSSFPQTCSDQRENLPVWSADGKYLYFISAEPYVANLPNEKNLYSLLQVAYDAETNTMGEPELLISSDEINGSIAFPSVSPDGRFMLFCRADFGYFPINNKSADVYLMDLQTKEYHKAPINSPESESYISWSDNSHWFVFNSRRFDGMTSKPFICHIDSNGEFSKPFVIPQKKADYYAIDHRTFCRPELLKERVSLSFRDLQPAIFSKAVVAGYQKEQITNLK